MAIRGYNGDAFIWDYDADTLVYNLLPTLTTSSIAITPDDSLLIIGYHQSIGPNNEYKYKINKYSINQKLFLDSIDAYDDNALDISPDGLSFAHSSKWTNGGHEYGNLIIRNLNTWEIIKDFDPPYNSGTSEGLIKDIKFSPDGKYIGIAKWDGTVKVYRTDSLDLYRNFVVYGPSIDGGPTRISFSNNSQYIYAGLFVHDNYTTKLWNIENNELIFTYDCISVDGLDVSSHEYIISCGAVFINLLTPKWLSVDDDIHKSQSTPSYVISKSSGYNFQFDAEFIDFTNYELFDYFGNTVITGKNCSEINPENLACGLYFLKINAGKESRVIKIFVVE
jgi:WD40 repeat protein